MTEEICLAVSSSHPLAHTGHISVEQMMDEKFIDLADTPSYAGVFNLIFSKFKKTPHFRSIYYQPLGSFCSENQRIFEHQLEEYFKNLNN